MPMWTSHNYRTARKGPRGEPQEDDLSPESVLSSPISASQLVRNGQLSSLKKLRKREFAGNSHESGTAGGSTVPEPKVLTVSTPVPEAPMSIETVSEGDSAGANVTGGNPKDAEPFSVKSPSAIDKKAQDSLGAHNEELWTIEAIKNHRGVDDSIELQIKWDNGDVTWEPEFSIQKNAPDVLFSYWVSKGARPPHPSEPELFRIFAIKKIAPRGRKILVEWLGYKEQTWEPRATVEEAAPEMLKEFEARQSQGKKRRRRQ